MVSTNKVANELQTSPASVTDMLKRLDEREFVEYIPYKGVRLRQEGLRVAVYIIRKHRLWEVFLHNVLAFDWHEVHPVAEQLEHIKSEELINKLEAFLGYPKFDPHGDPIPDKNGEIIPQDTTPLFRIAPGTRVELAAVSLQDQDFLKYLSRLNLRIGGTLEVVEPIAFDNSLLIRLGEKELIIQERVAENLFVRPV